MLLMDSDGNDDTHPEIVIAAIVLDNNAVECKARLILIPKLLIVTYSMIGYL